MFIWGGPIPHFGCPLFKSWLKACVFSKISHCTQLMYKICYIPRSHNSLPQENNKKLCCLKNCSFEEALYHILDTHFSNPGWKHVSSAKLATVHNVHNVLHSSVTNSLPQENNKKFNLIINLETGSDFFNWRVWGWRVDGRITARRWEIYYGFTSNHPLIPSNWHDCFDWQPKIQIS